MAQGGMFGGGNVSPRMLMAQQLLAQGGSGAPVQHWTQGLNRLAQSLVGARMAGMDSQDEQAAMAALGQGISAPQWVNPDTGTPEARASNVAGAPMVPTPQAGGYEGAIAALGGLQGNRMAQDLMSRLAMGKFESDIASKQQLQQLMAEYGLKSAESDRDRAADFENQKALAEMRDAAALERTKISASQQNALIPGRDVPYSPDVARQKQEIAGGMADAKTRAKLTAEQPQAKLSIGIAVADLNRLDTALEELKADPALPAITGTVDARTPTIRQGSVDAEAKLKTIKDQIVVSALQSMRNASKTGGALGNATERELDRLENSMAALDPRMGTDEFVRQLKKVQAQVRHTNGLLVSAYDETYGDLTPDSGTPPTSPQPAGGIKAVDEMTLDELVAEEQRLDKLQRGGGNGR